MDSEALELKANVLESTLRRIAVAGSCVPGDPLDDAYTKAGGGDTGLQDMARKGLELAGVDTRPAPPTRERVDELKDALPKPNVDFTD